MAFTLPQSFYDDILSAFPDAEPSTVSAKVITSGGTTSIKGSVSADEQGTQSTISAITEADGRELTLTGDAAASGEAATTSLDLVASVDEQGAEGTVLAKAEAKPVEGGTAIASTDADATGFDQITKAQSPEGGEATETGDNAIAESSTYLEALGVESAEIETLELPLEDDGIAGLLVVLDWS